MYSIISRFFNRKFNIVNQSGVVGAVIFPRVAPEVITYYLIQSPLIPFFTFWVLGEAVPKDNSVPLCSIGY